MLDQRIDQSHANVLGMNKIELAKSLYAERGWALLETEFVSMQTPMRYLCSCGEERQINLKRLKRGEGGCKPCSIKRGAAKRRISLKQATEDFAGVGCELLATDYTSANISLPFRCLTCGFEGAMRLGTVRQGHGCRLCSQRAKGLQNRRGIRHAKDAFDSINLDLQETVYVNNHAPMRYRCRTCGSEGKTDLKSVQGGHGCRTCGIRSKSGPSHSRWIADRRERAFRKKMVDKCMGLLRHCRKSFRTNKTDRAHKVLGYTPRDLRKHLESHPNWPRIDRDGSWHLDHIFPIKAFLEHGVFDPKVINCLENLQPLPSKDNLSKSGTYSEKDFLGFLTRMGVKPSSK